VVRFPLRPIRKAPAEVFRHRRSNLSQINLRDPAGGHLLRPLSRVNRRPVAAVSEETPAMYRRQTHRARADLFRRQLSHKLRQVVPPLLSRGHSLRRVAPLRRIRAPEILGDNLDRTILNRVNHHGSIKTILAGTPADMVTAGRLSICSSRS
jgi:hypothetical protein